MGNAYRVLDLYRLRTSVPLSTTNYQLITVLFTNISSYDIITIYRLIRRRAAVSRALRQQNFHLRDSKLCCSADFLFKTVIARGFDPVAISTDKKGYYTGSRRHIQGADTLGYH